MAQDGRVTVVLGPKHDKSLISELEAYALKHTAGNVTQAARELMAKGLVKGLNK